MSEYLEAHREEYNGSLREISNSGDWNSWIIFFLKAFIFQAKENCIRAEKIIKLYNMMKLNIHDLSTTYSLPALDTLFMMPIFNSTDFINFSKIPKTSANRLLKQLVDKKIIKIMRDGKGRTPALYLFTDLLNVSEGYI